MATYRRTLTLDTGETLNLNLTSVVDDGEAKWRAQTPDLGGLEVGEGDTPIAAVGEFVDKNGSHIRALDEEPPESFAAGDGSWDVSNP